MVKHASILQVVFTTLLFCQNHCLEGKVVNTQATNFHPANLREEAKALIDDVNQLVLGSILVAETQLSDFDAEIASDAVNAHLNTEVHIGEEYLSIEEQLTSLKNLAQAAGVNVSSCLEGSEDRLNSLPDVYIYKADECITEIRQDAKSMLDTTLIWVDVTITSVQNLYFQLDQCTSDGCIEILLILIKDDAESLPEKIHNYVDEASDDSAVAKTKIQECSNANLADFVYDAHSIFTQIADCVNNHIP